MNNVRLAVFKVALFVIGIIMMVTTFSDAKAIWKKDFGKIYDKGIHDYNEDELVTGKIEYVFDAVATLESSQTVYGIPVSKKTTPYYLCLIPYNEATDTEGYFLIVHVTNEDNIKAMDSLVRSTSYILESDGDVTSSTKPVALELKTRPIPEEVMDYTLEYMADGESSDAELKSMIAGYMLEETDYDSDKFLPLIGLIITLIPIIWIIVSRRKTVGYKSSRTHYVNEASTDPYNTAPVAANGTPAAPMKRYSSGAYEAHTAPGGLPQQQETPYGGPEGYEPGEMDSIDTSNLNL